MVLAPAGDRFRRPDDKNRDLLLRRAYGKIRRQRRADRGRGRRARGMAKTARAHRMTLRVGSDVKDDVIGTVGASGCDSSRNVIKVQRMTDLPRDDVIGAGSIATHPDGSDERA